jgi:hypothetical protein
MKNIFTSYIKQMKFSNYFLNLISTQKACTKLDHLEI